MNKITMGLMAVLAISAVSCKKNLESAGSADRALHAGPFVDTVTLSGAIAANRTLTKDTLYLLDGKVFVTKGATLTINAGTRIEGVKYTSAISSSALIVIRGAKISANGTSALPITFTSNQGDDAEPGDWGGIVVLGKAKINKADTLIEGIDNSIAASLPALGLSLDSLKYGGGGANVGNDADNSGIITYTVIKFAGASISANNELNGLTLGGVGNGTVLSYIESAYGRDDAFEFFGGAVNADHLVALAADDDSYDTDFGFRGTISYSLSILDPNKPSYSSDPNGLEADNDGSGTNALPFSHPVYDHMTIIGLQDSTKAGILGKKILYGARLRRATNYTITNSIFMGFVNGISIESDSSVAHIANFHHNLVHGYRAPVLQSALSATVLTNNGPSFYTDIANANTSIKLGTSTSTPWNLGSFIPASDSPAKDGGVSNTYRGAFQPSVTAWTAGWADLAYWY